MRTRHTVAIRAQCPVNGDKDLYKCYVWPKDGQIIYCERILEVVKELTMDPVTQEELTQNLANKLGCLVRTIGNHCKGDVKTKVTCHCEVNLTDDELGEEIAGEEHEAEEDE